MASKSLLSESNCSWGSECGGSSGRSETEAKIALVGFGLWPVMPA